MKFEIYVKPKATQLCSLLVVVTLVTRESPDVLNENFRSTLL